LVSKQDLWGACVPPPCWPPLQKGEVQGRLAAVESQGGFGAGGLWVEAYRAELVPGGLLFLCWYVNRVTEPRGWLPSAGNR